MVHSGNRLSVSALSGESILGPHQPWPECYDFAPVSALSGESILGPHHHAAGFGHAVELFQHSLVSLFWGHKKTETRQWHGLKVCFSTLW